jgi:hypothetical protein
MDQFAPEQPSMSQPEVQADQGAPQITSLDSLSEFEFQGERLTPERLQEVFQGYKALSERQKQSQSEERYWSNLDADIENVMANPTLADKFKQVYPEKFHRILERMMGQTQGQQQQSQGLPKEYLSKLSKVDQLEQTLHQMAVESANAKLDALLPKLYEKYPMANEDQVLARAEAMLSQGMKLNDQAWERIAKESHEAVSKKADAFYKKQLQTQLDKGQLGKDAGPGGSVPGKAPQKLRTFDDAYKAAMEHAKSQGMV